jgi:biotin carboxyl carrier protein
MRYDITMGETTYSAQVESIGGRLYRVSFLDRDHRVDVFEVSENLYSLICDGQSYEVDIAEGGNIYAIFLQGASYSVQVLRPGKSPPSPAKEERVSSGEEVVVSPMTCTVVRILVKPGEMVDNDQDLLITEAMKLEMPIPSPVRGTVKEVLIKEGETIDRGTRLITLAPLE